MSDPGYLGRHSRFWLADRRRETRRGQLANRRRAQRALMLADAAELEITGALRLPTPRELDVTDVKIVAGPAGRPRMLVLRPDGSEI